MTARRAAWLLVVLAVVLSACGERGAPHTLTVGEHRVSVRIPAGAELLDQGRQVRVRSAGVELVLQDLGPAGPPGIRREVERAQGLWRDGRVDEARWRLANVPLPRSLFATPADERAFRATWAGLTGDSARALSFAEAAPRFIEVMAGIAALPEASLPEIAQGGLEALGHDPQRDDVKARTAVAVGGNDALDVETWNRLAHTSPRRFVFVRSDDFLFALYTATDADAGTTRAFTALRDSLQFLPTGGSDRR